MQRVVRLVTFADVREDVHVGRGRQPLVDAHGWTAAPSGAGAELDPRSISVSARHEAVMDDGSRLLLLDDRGWTASARGAGAGEIDDLWALTSAQDIDETARMVVGPDEAFGERSQADMERDHWNALAETLRAHGVVVDAGELRQLPHDVELSDRLRARLAQSAGDTT